MYSWESTPRNNLLLGTVSYGQSALRSLLPQLHQNRPEGPDHDDGRGQAGEHPGIPGNWPLRL